LATFPTPEEAARAVVDDKFDRLVGVVVRGDTAIVAQWVKAGSPNHVEDTETTTCYRVAEGWEAGSTGNGNGGRILTSEDRMTFVWWDKAPTGATAVRVSLGEQERTVPVETGFFFTVFDDVPFQEPQHPPLDHGQGFVRRGKLSPEQRRAFFGFDQPQVREWLFEDEEPPP
jgi:hypothetical protein